MDTLKVELDDRSYPILIGADLLGDPAVLDRAVRGSGVLLVSNSVVAPLYAARLAGALGRRRVVEAILPDGEAHKTLANVSRLLDVLVANRFNRDSTVIALGGGVVGDMAGFAAACYQRGVPYVQVPTTLLAQVDSSVGGKTGVNHPGGKNLIGAFHQPAAVVTDVSTLATLPQRELRAGLAEVIKYGLIRDAAFYGWLEQNMDRLLGRQPEALARAIRRSCEIKAEIVARDEREQGERALLNLGHTFGHAIEAATAYRGWLHGEAVGAGMLMAASLSRELGTLEPAAVDRLRALLERTGLPVAARDVPAGAALEHMRIDKKVKAGRIRLVLLKGIGSAYVTGEYPDGALRATVEAYHG
ncbi:MAG: 3-dehydroquinate synthase [Steroidobacteraceae bacterium]